LITGNNIQNRKNNCKYRAQSTPPAIYSLLIAVFGRLVSSPMKIIQENQPATPPRTRKTNNKIVQLFVLLTVTIENLLVLT